jgi:hypothetical protein
MRQTGWMNNQSKLPKIKLTLEKNNYHKILYYFDFFKANAVNPQIGYPDQIYDNKYQEYLYGVI